MNQEFSNGKGRNMNQGFGGRGQGQGMSGGRGRGYGRQKSSVMDFSGTDDLSQLIHSCSHYLRQSEMSSLGGTQYKILGILKEKGNMTQRELMELLHVRAGSLSEIIKKLETKGLVEKMPNPDDRRSMLISLTPSGEQQFENCDGECGCAFGVLDDDRKEQLRGLLKDLLGSWYE